MLEKEPSGGILIATALFRRLHSESQDSRDSYILFSFATIALGRKEHRVPGIRNRHCLSACQNEAIQTRTP